MLHDRTKKALLRSVVWVALILVVWFNVAHLRHTRGISMLPTLGEGSWVVVYELGSHFHAPRRGDIVCVRSNERPLEVFCKRVIAEPGEEIEIRRGVVWINGVELHEPYAVINPMWQLPRTKLDDQHVYVIGDNRGMAMRNHRQGQAALSNILGRVVWVLYRGRTRE
jgi:signal peptidase I